MHDWSHRAFSAAEAAAVAGMSRGMLDVVLHRCRGMETLFSERRGSRRWFSARDISILRVAHDMERAGRQWSSAIACAFDNLEHPPPADAVLVMKITHPRGRERIIDDRDIARLPVEQSLALFPIGKIVAQVRAACAEIMEAA